LIFTGHSPEYEELGAITVPNHRHYAQANGYDLFVHHHERGNEAADLWDRARWRKMLWLLPQYELIMTIGADALFMRTDIRFDSIIEPNFDQVIAEEKIGGCTHNNDVMIWRNAQSSFDLINWILDEYDVHMQKPLGYQATICDRLWRHDATLCKMQTVKPNVMNTCPQKGHGSTYQEGDFIIHFMGAILEDKVRLAKEWIKKIK
jgi:hypothetical protein